MGFAAFEGNGGCSDTIKLNVIVHELPEADILFTESMCEDIPVKNDLVLYNQVIKANWNFEVPHPQSPCPVRAPYPAPVTGTVTTLFLTAIPPFCVDCRRHRN